MSDRRDIESQRAPEPVGAFPHAKRVGDFPFWLLTSRSMQYAWGGNVGMQLIHEVAGNVAGHGGVIINAGKAAELGIADGDMVEIATHARKVRAKAVLRQGIRPDTLLLIAQFDHWVTPYAKDFGVPSMNRLTPMSMPLTDASRATFFSRIARAPRPVPRCDSRAMASLGPTPLTLVRRWKKRRVSSSAKPYSDQPSSRTTSSVARVTVWPTAGSLSMTPSGMVSS